MVKEHFCLQCESVWGAKDADHCPNCGSHDISSDDSWDTQGHVESDLAALPEYED